jgi:transposase InsO family protein
MGRGHHQTEFVYLAVILDGFSRKVVGWEWDRTLAARLTIAALEQAIEKRGPEPGLVHHSDRGFQYACAEYIAILETYRMVPSMSRPANPYDNASYESFIKTLKREEISSDHGTEPAGLARLRAARQAERHDLIGRYPQERLKPGHPEDSRAGTSSV